MPDTDEKEKCEICGQLKSVMDMKLFERKPPPGTDLKIYRYWICETCLKEFYEQSTD